MAPNDTRNKTAPTPAKASAADRAHTIGIPLWSGMYMVGSIECNMRVLVIGASGYIGSRAIPVLLSASHEVIAAVRTPAKLDRFWWRERVCVRPLDVLDQQSITSAITSDIEAIVYLVHGMAGDNFRETDRRAAASILQAADNASVARIVYVSGIVPVVPESRFSEHLTSRLEVEKILSQIRGSAITLRAAMIIGAGSTSYAIMSQLARRLPVTVLPDWMNHRVEPLAVTDLTDAIAGAVTVTAKNSRHYDVGGGTQIAYPELIAKYLSINNLERPSVRVPLLPQSLVAEAAARIADVPDPTVRALIESLQDDMVTSDQSWIGDLVSPTRTPISIDEALQRVESPIDYIRAPSQRDPLQTLPGDPRWAR